MSLMRPMEIPVVADATARAMQSLAAAGWRLGQRHRATPFPDCRPTVSRLTGPLPGRPTPVRIYAAPGPDDRPPPVHVNFHGGGFVMGEPELDDPLCRFLAAEAGVTVVNVDYVLAPQHRFPAAPHQAFELVRWVAENGAEHGWDGSRLTIGGQSAGGALAAAAARQALIAGGPRIALQVLQYPPLDLVTPARDKPAANRRPVIPGWMGAVFDTAYIPRRSDRADPLASPAHPGDTADLTGIAPALVIACELDRLKVDSDRYADRLRQAGALVDYVVVPDADHGYDNTDPEGARPIYSRISTALRTAAG